MGGLVEEYPRDRLGAIVSRLLHAMPELEPSYKEHIVDNRELLPYVFLPDAIRDAQRQMDDHSLPSDFFDRFAKAIEEVLQTDPASHDLIAIGVLEELRASPRFWQRVKDKVGRRTMDVINEASE
jgi:hypothetical protein